MGGLADRAARGSTVAIAELKKPGNDLLFHPLGGTGYNKSGQNGSGSKDDVVLVNEARLFCNLETDDDGRMAFRTHQIFGLLVGDFRPSAARGIAGLWMRAVRVWIPSSGTE